MRAWEAAAESAESAEVASAEPARAEGLGEVSSGAAAASHAEGQGGYPAAEAALPSFALPALKPMPAMSDAAVQQVMEHP